MGIEKHIRSIRAYPGRLVVLALAWTPSRLWTYQKYLQQNRW